jgi:hypothetical protein
MERLTIRNIHDNYPLWKKIIELDYDLLGLADDIFVSPIRYYFSSTGFGLILSRDVLIISGKEKNSVKKEAVRLERRIRSSGRTP